MTSPLLETKLYVPRRHGGLVARPRLAERLCRGIDAKLTLISAPAGFGKTTLLAEWLDSMASGERSIAWLSLDQADSDAASFWTYVTTSLQRATPAAGAALALTRCASACGAAHRLRAGLARVFALVAAPNAASDPIGGGNSVGPGHDRLVRFSPRRRRSAAEGRLKRHLPR